MTTQLARLVADAHISRLALIGLAKNVGKTTTTNHLLTALLGEGFYRAAELALTSLGLDGEPSDAVTGLPKPRYVPRAGMLVATTADLLRQAESTGARVAYLLQLPGRTSLGPVFLARVEQPGRIAIAGPTLLRDIAIALERSHEHGARLGIVDGAMNRLGAASPAVSDACIVCTGTSVGGTPELVARRTVDVVARLSTEQTRWRDAYRLCLPGARLLTFPAQAGAEHARPYNDLAEPPTEAAWLVAQLQRAPEAVFLLRGAFSEELARELLAQLSRSRIENPAEIIVGDGTKIFCHAAVIQGLAARGLLVRVASSISILALTINPYTPEYTCTAQGLLDALLKELPAGRPPIIDVVAGLSA